MAPRALKFTMVCLRRDPLDCTRSPFRTYLVQYRERSSKLASTATHVRPEDAMFALRYRRLPERILIFEQPPSTAPKSSLLQVRELTNPKGSGNSAPDREHTRAVREADSVG